MRDLPPPLRTSALARTLDFSFPSNRFAVVGTAGSVVAARLSGRAWSTALEVGAAGFLAWATARELDPDHPDTANAALPLAALTALLGGTPQPLAGLGVLSGLRTLAGTVGNAPTPLDVAALAAQATVSARRGARVAALVPGTALALSTLPSDALRAFGGAPWLTVAAGLFPSGGRAGREHSVPSDVLTLAALGLTLALSAPEALRSRRDRSPLAVSAERVRLARLLAVGTLGAGLLARQTRALAPLAAAALTVGLRRVQPVQVNRQSKRRPD
ncbi:hypothetical protein [Deinococcus sp. S9]|uniref:hypothetical protein n=1 Tax=Deinococcus sp. S9 TaxID=2545754 RepID=UPI001055F1B1|nr:hypothetical protein [Deinococcus sp. S9]TDE87540.1 hypothetical protein E0686_00515 [Deinococcus sp. S9]